MPIPEHRQFKYSFMLTTDLYAKFEELVPKGLRACVLRGITALALDEMSKDPKLMLDLMAMDPEGGFKGAFRRLSLRTEEHE